MQDFIGKFKCLEGYDLVTEFKTYEQCKNYIVSNKEGQFAVKIINSMDKDAKKTLDAWYMQIHISEKVNGVQQVYKLYREGSYYIALTDCVSTMTLTYYLKHTHDYTQKTAYKIFKNICYTVNAIHKLPEPVVLRNLHPSIFLIDPRSKNTEIYDLRYAVYRNTKPYMIADEKEHVRYMDDEGVQDVFNEISVAADIYTLGVLGYEMLYPKADKFSRDALEKAITNKTINKKIGKILLKATDPVETRYKSVEELILDLERI